MTVTGLSNKRLFEYLEIDGIEIEEEVLNKAKNNDVDSLSTIAGIYYDLKCYTKAIDWYSMAADKNHAFSQWMIGKIYHRGQGVLTNYKTAMDWYLEAHNNGCILATTNIGVLYSKGQGVPRNHKTALIWFLEAAKKGDPCALNNVGACYEYGYGTTKDMHSALEWYEKSADKEYKVAKDNLVRLSKESWYIEYSRKRYLRLEAILNEMKERFTVLENKLKAN